ncbi:hypothetical protein F5141DRAFT_1210777 [Pisolithus sp. B1]|nr:hypothetical protein F5141DRAFT_1210777 [Pisolithus sp. B1]
MAGTIPPYGLMVIVQYNPRKFEGWGKKDIINAVLDDIERLRVHFPSRKNIRLRGDRWVTLHWPMSRRDAAFHGTNSLYSRWVKLSRGDESQQLLENLLIDSIVVVDGGRMISSSAFSWNAAIGHTPSSKTPTIPPGSSTTLAVSSGTYSPPKAMGLPIPRKRRLSAPDDDVYPIRQRLDNTTDDGVSPNPIRRRVDTSTTTTSVERYALEDQTNNRGPDSDSMSDMRLPTIRSESTTIRPPCPHHPLTQSVRPPSPSQAAAAADIQPVVAARDDRCCVEQEAAEEDDRNVHRAPSSSARRQLAVERVPLLWREVLEIRRQQVILRDKETVLLDEMDRLGRGAAGHPAAQQLLPLRVRLARLTEMEAELREERDRRIRAEQALEQVERECKSPFVVPALFRAFMTISEFST